MLIDDIDRFGYRGPLNVIVDDLGHIYKITHVYVHENKASIVTSIFYDSTNNKYYCDPECTMLIDDLSVLGEMKDKNIIMGNNGVIYEIISADDRGYFNKQGKSK